MGAPENTGNEAGSITVTKRKSFPTPDLRLPHRSRIVTSIPVYRNSGLVLSPSRVASPRRIEWYKSHTVALLVSTLA